MSRFHKLCMPGRAVETLSFRFFRVANEMTTYCFGSNFPIFRLKTLASAGHPHTCIYLKEGSLPVHNSYGVVGTDLLGTLFRM
jgi:hypothetical protein